VPKCIAEGIIDGAGKFKAGGTLDIQKESSETEPLAILRVDNLDSGNLGDVLFFPFFHLWLFWS